MERDFNAAATKASYYPLWRVVLTTLAIISLLTVSGQLVGRQFFWSELDTRRIERELDYFRQLVDSDPTNPEHRVDLGYTFFKRGQYDQALVQFEEALRLDANFMPAYLSRGYVFFELALHNEALASFVRVTELAPQDYRGHLNTGISYRELGMYDEASESLSLAKTFNPAAAEISYHFGVLFERQGLPDAALEAYQEALTINPLFQDALQAAERLQQR
ncbi:MAG: tetratricopeptide repeat protein [Firmicutes bacterium]|jgi:tetratricopeptide (TPR) repeat protein|nr:tetratricopeptide repeat protein [Dethiobacter sp.]MBS3899845.1 tetratricopeptide repeat protein [Dethiobacter sp.]MCL4463913.1 tetratricopeptide repeat protein [Bacillota bacterium]MCL5994082.1 tetratricopeptide repeat protein [Bacillota bacterium]